MDPTVDAAASGLVAIRRPALRSPVAGAPDERHAVLMTKHLEAPFTMNKWEEVSGEPVEGGPDAGHVVLAKTYTGPDLVGSSTGHALTTRGERGASYVAQERVVGTLDGLPGSFVLEHRASMGEGFPTLMDAMVVHGSGTGALVDLAGQGLVEHGMLILDYDLS